MRMLGQRVVRAMEEHEGTDPLPDDVEEYRAGVPQPEPLPNDDHPMPYHFVGDEVFGWILLCLRDNTDT